MENRNQIEIENRIEIKSKSKSKLKSNRKMHMDMRTHTHKRTNTHKHTNNQARTLPHTDAHTDVHRHTLTRLQHTHTYSWRRGTYAPKVEALLLSNASSIINVPNSDRLSHHSNFFARRRRRNEVAPLCQIAPNVGPGLEQQVLDCFEVLDFLGASNLVAREFA